MSILSIGTKIFKSSLFRNRSNWAIVLVMAISYTSLYASTLPLEGDTLLVILDNEKLQDTTRIKAAINFVRSTNGPLDEIDRVYKKGARLANKLDDKNFLLWLTNNTMLTYCKRGETNYCDKHLDLLNTLADKHGSIEYKCRGMLTRANNSFKEGNVTAAREIINDVLELSRSENLPEFTATAYTEIAVYFRQAGKIDSSLHYLQLSSSVLKNIDIGVALINNYNGLGRTHRHLGNTDSAEIYFLKALTLSDSLQYEPIKRTLYNNLGNISHVKGNYDEALHYYLSSIELKKKVGDERGLAIGYHNIGAIKTDVKEYTQAIAEYKKSERIAKKINLKSISVHNSLKIGHAYSQLNELDSSYYYYTLANDIAKEIKFKKGEAIALIGLGTISNQLEKYELALDQLQDGLSLATAIQSKSEECSALVAIAELYIKADESDVYLNKNYTTKEIEKILLRAKILSDEMEYGEKKLAVYEGLNKLYTATNNTAKQAPLLSEFMTFKDSLYSKNRTDALASWETKYATAEKEKEILKLENENQISKLQARSWQVALGVTTLFLVLLGFLGYKYQKRKNAQKQMEEAERFRSQLSSDLHDDVGTMLSSLAMQSEVMSLTAAPPQVQKFEKLSTLSREAMARMRDTVWAIDSRKDKVENLLDRMKDYLTDILNGQNLSVDFKENVESLNQNMRPDIRQNVYLIFKEAVNNAAKYSQGDQLKIRYDQTNSLISLLIHDNGEVSNIKKSGTGLSNMTMRAKRLGGSLKVDHTDGFSIILEIPL